MPRPRTDSSDGADGADGAWAQAIDAWRRAIGGDRVDTDTARYNVDTSSFTGDIPVALRPASVEQVQEVVRVAQRFAVPVHPISTGHNWGYGTSVPARSPAAIVDLSGMNRILEFDHELGVVTLEPGVTQGDLAAYLASRRLPYMVPVTGAGPSCSIIANALERGFGVTPLTDHFAAVISVKAVLPDGEIFESATRACNAAGLARAFKWGTGPYLDGLFSQSGFGIVVDASIALQVRPERRGALFFTLDSDRQVEEATAAIRRLLTAAGHTIGAINVLSRGRVAAMLGGSARVADAGATSPGRHPSMPAGAWFGFASLYGSREHFGATGRLVRRTLHGTARRIRIHTSADVARLRRLSAVAAAVGWSVPSGVVARLQAAIDVVDGIPSTFALPLAYARSGQADARSGLDPARDGCGLFWYAPIVPLRGGVVGRFIEFAQRTCGRHGLPAPITLTTLSPRCYAATVPLLFERADPDDERRATACFEDLYTEGLALGFMPYRIGSQFMPALARHGAAPLARAVKSAIDPNRVLAPGRYAFD